MSELPTSLRNPLVRPRTRSWIVATPEARWYLLRELTVIPMAAMALHLLGGLIAAARGLEYWQGWIAYSRNPFVVIAVLIALTATALQAYTWFVLSSSIVRLRIGERRVPKSWIIGAQCGAALAALVVIGWLVMRGGAS